MLIESHKPILRMHLWRSMIRWQLPAAIICVLALVFGVRAYALDQSYNIFIDEITYLHIGNHLAEHGSVKLYGKTFHLHPPAFFFIEAAYLRLTQASGSMIDQIYSVRHLNTAFAAITAVLLLLNVRHVAGLGIGLIVAMVYAIDSFIIRMNSMVLLDTSAMMWAIAGYALLLPALPEAEQRPLLRWSWPWITRFGQRINAFIDRIALVERVITPDMAPVALWRLIGAGLCFGLALLTKDMMAFLTLLPMSMIVVLGWPLKRWSALLVGAITCLTYAPYPAITALVGDWDRYAVSKLRGVLRLAGLVKETGIRHADGGPSLIQKVIERLDSYATTYALIAFGVLAIIVLLAIGGRASRMLAILGASSYALLAYCILFGTLEEQFFYYLVVPALLVIGVAAGLLLRSARPGTRFTAIMRLSLVLICIIVLSWNSYQWARSRMHPDNGYEQAVIYIETMLPPDARVASTSEVGQFLLSSDRDTGPWGSWGSVESLRGSKANYVLVSLEQLRWSHSKTSGALLEWLHANGDPVFTFVGNRAGNTLILYHLRIRP